MTENVAFFLAFFFLAFFQCCLCVRPVPRFFMDDDLNVTQKLTQAVSENCQETRRVTLYAYSGLGSCVVGVIEAWFFALHHGICFALEESVSALRSEGDASFWNLYFNALPSRFLPAANELSHVPEVKAYWRSNMLRKWDGKQECSEACLFFQYAWRLKPEISHLIQDRYLKLGLPSRFAACSLRRGDKHVLERDAHGPDPYPVAGYVNHLSRLMQHFQLPPIVYISADDCTVVNEFRSLRPSWTFVHACNDTDVGFHIMTFRTWSREQKREHLEKFFLELFALSVADVALVTTSSNKGFLVQHLRQRDPVTTILVDAADQ
jgi:hypothetical protein